MKQEEYLRIQKLFIFGIIVSIVTIFGGEIPIGWVVNPEADNEILYMADMGIGSLITFGGLLILLNKYQYEQV